jgi:hypothetical protein
MRNYETEEIPNLPLVQLIYYDICQHINKDPRYLEHLVPDIVHISGYLLDDGSKSNFIRISTELDLSSIGESDTFAVPFGCKIKLIKLTKEKKQNKKEKINDIIKIGKSIDEKIEKENVKYTEEQTNFIINIVKNHLKQDGKISIDDIIESYKLKFEFEFKNEDYENLQNKIKEIEKEIEVDVNVK